MLGELVLPSGEGMWTSAVIDVLGRTGVEEKATRQVLMRTAADGWLGSERHGRRTRWHLTVKAERLLVQGTQRIYGFQPVAPQWDGRLVLVLARVPETDRAARHLLRTRLAWAGFGTPSPGLWVSTHADRAAEASALLASVDLPDARVFVAEHAGGADLASMVEQAWDLGAVEDGYQGFLDEFAPSHDRPGTRDPLARLIELVHAWRRFPSIDPSLPRDLLPKPWSGPAAAALFARRHATWGADAAAEWARLASPTSPIRP